MLRTRLPTFPDVLRVASIVTTFLYGWTIVVWMWQVPSWLLSLTLGEILSIFAYAMLNALLESLFVLACIIAVTFLLPPRFLRNDFVIRASWFTIGALGLLLGFFFGVNALHINLIQYINLWSVTDLLIAVLLAFLSMRFAWMRTSALWISDRLLIFLFLFVPITVISLLTVIIRNLF